MGWGVSTQLLGITPSTINGGAFDVPGLMNVTFMYTGPVVHSNGSIVAFTGFQIVSSFGLTAPGNFSFQATKDTGAEAGNTDQGSGPTTVPSTSAGGAGGPVPEPSTMVLLGAGLLGLAVAGRLRRRA